MNRVHDSSGEEAHDTQTGMLPRVPGSARCVQRFDDSLSVLQFTSLIAFSHVLHRCGSREIRRQELLRFPTLPTTFDFKASDDDMSDPRGHQPNHSCLGFRHKKTGQEPRNQSVHRGVWLKKWQPVACAPAPGSILILPQVHLRKPCYDFYFL